MGTVPLERFAGLFCKRALKKRPIFCKKDYITKICVNDAHRCRVVCLQENFDAAACVTTAHCNALQRTATRCNTLQHTATHCNTLQHTATYCYILQHTATHCNTLQRTAPHYNTLHHTAAHCDTLQLTTICVNDARR